MDHARGAPLAIEERAALIADETLTGRELCRALSQAADTMLGDLFTSALEGRRLKARVALIAIGGYGRGELAPQSDLDVVLVFEGRNRDLDEIARAMWYPVWDSRLKLGHAVRSLGDQLALAADDLDTATALLSSRRIAGDEELADRLGTEAVTQWRRRGRRWLDALQARTATRRAAAGEVAYLLEPDLKEGAGGLRDVHTLWWAAAADLVLPRADLELLERCYDSLVSVRVALHRVTGKPGDVLRLEQQDAVAARLGATSADALMADVAAAARSISWLVDGAWHEAARHVVDTAVEVGLGVVLVGGEIELGARADPATDPTLVLRAAVAAARHQAPLSRSCLDRLAAGTAPWSGDWPAGGREALVELLLEGHRAIDVLETLDQRSLLVRLLPEWAPVRSRPQRNAYHRFTVDRHLWEVAANAAALTGRVERPDLLVLGALFHDIGKGYPGDHTDAGVDQVTRIAPRLGLDEDDADVLVALVRHHLLLPDVAVRRDLGDPATIASVAQAVGSIERLDLLHALTEADSLGTGPSAWSSWKAQLVADLVQRVRHVLAGGAIGDVAGRPFPDAETLTAMACGELAIIATPGVADEPDATRVTVVSPDAPGTFAKVAGVLLLHGYDVLSALAHTGDGEPSMAASQFRAVAPAGGKGWVAVESDLRRALAGELAIEARLADRARTYRRRRATRAAPPAPASVTFDDAASSGATVLEIRAPNRIGVLYRIAKALAELGLDIRHATVQTLGEDVVDTFYVRNQFGQPVTDRSHRAEIERALLHAAS
jgi:[protein-PII] uridylyltransferase